MSEAAGTGVDAGDEFKRMSEKVAKLTEMMAAANKEKYEMGKKLMEGKKSKKTMESQIDSLTGEVTSLREANAVLLRQLQDTPIGDEIEIMAENRTLKMEKIGMQSEHTRVKGMLDQANRQLAQASDLSSSAFELRRAKDEAVKNMEVLNIRVESEIASLTSNHKAEIKDLISKLLQEQRGREHMRSDLRRLSDMATDYDQLTKEVEMRRKVQGECKYCSLSVHNASRDDLERAGSGNEGAAPKMSAFKAAMRRKILVPS